MPGYSRIISIGVVPYLQFEGMTVIADNADCLALRIISPVAGIIAVLPGRVGEAQVERHRLVVGFPFGCGRARLPAYPDGYEVALGVADGLDMIAEPAMSEVRRYLARPHI